MKAFLLSSIGCLLLFYSLYAIFFQHLSFHRWNRVYLIVTLLLSIGIPFLKLPGTAYLSEGIAIRQTLAIQQAPVTSSIMAATNEEDFNWLEGIYWMGVCIMALLFIINIIKLFKKIRNGTTDVNASFFHYIFIQKNLAPEEERIILLHEKAHQQQLHSLDNLLLEIVKVFCWFNPFVYVYSRLLRSVHELEADQITTGQIDKATYAQLLLKFNTEKGSGLLNLYSLHPLKRRIHSLFNDKTNNMKKALYLLVLPCLILAISSFTFIKPPLNGVLIKSDSTELTMQISLGTLLGPNASWKAFENFENTTFKKAQAMFMDKGYKLTLTEKVQGSNGSIELIGFKLEGKIGNGSSSTSATYRVNNMISKGYYIMISADEKSQQLWVNSSMYAVLK